jgi:arylsulfatase A-like enzyme
MKRLSSRPAAARLLPVATSLRLPSPRVLLPRWLSSACVLLRRPLLPRYLLLPAALLLAAGCGGRGDASRPDKLVHLTEMLREGGTGARIGSPVRSGGAGHGGVGGGTSGDGSGSQGAAAAATPMPSFPAGEATPELPYEVTAPLSAAGVGRLRLEAQGTARLATLSWRLPQDGGFSRFRALSFPVAGDGALHVYEVDLEREAHWHGRVEGLRLAVEGGRLRLASLIAEPPDEPYRSMSLGGETMPALAGGGRIEIPLPDDLPAGTRFEAYAGLLPEYDRPGVTAVFNATLLDAAAEPGGASGEAGGKGQRAKGTGAGDPGRRAWLRETVAGGSAGGPAWRPVRRELPAAGAAGRGGAFRWSGHSGAPHPQRKLLLEATATRGGQLLPEGAVVWGNPVLVRPGRPAGSNLVVILIDTLRADVLGSYGDRLGLTPRLDAFAREGVRFADMQAPSPWTLPSVCSLLTGLQPQTHGAGQRFGDLDPASPRQNDFAPTGLPGGLRTMAGVLRRQGFYTMGVYENFYILPGFGVHQGFDDYASYEERAGALVDQALERLRRTAGDRRVFMYLHLFDMHSPYNPPEPECTQVARRLAPGYHGRLGCEGDRNPERTTIPPPADRPWFAALYRAELAYTDHQVGRFLGGLHGLGLADRTVVAVVSDHGEEFWDRLDQESRLGYETNSDHGHTLYQELVQVPVLLRIPGRGPAVVREPAQLADLFPTLLRAVGVEPPASQGRDLTALLDGRPPGTAPPPARSVPPAPPGSPAPPADRPTLMADVILHGRPRWSVRRGPWKLVVARDSALPVELYDLRQDPEERANLAAREPRLVAAMRSWGERELAARLKARRQFLARADTLGATYLEWRYITKLRALGYLK